MQNLLIMIIGFIIGFILSYVVTNFLKKPTGKQISKIKEWLLWAVAQAERELGAGTGELKLRYVYSLFTSTWGGIAKLISFETFTSFANEALSRFKEMLKENQQIEDYIEGGGK